MERHSTSQEDYTNAVRWAIKASVTRKGEKSREEVIQNAVSFFLNSIDHNFEGSVADLCFNGRRLDMDRVQGYVHLVKNMQQYLKRLFVRASIDDYIRLLEWAGTDEVTKTIGLLRDDVKTNVERILRGEKPERPKRREYIQNATFNFVPQSQYTENQTAERYPMQEGRPRARWADQQEPQPRPVRYEGQVRPARQNPAPSDGQGPRKKTPHQKRNNEAPPSAETVEVEQPEPAEVPPAVEEAEPVVSEKKKKIPVAETVIEIVPEEVATEAEEAPKKKKYSPKK